MYAIVTRIMFWTILLSIITGMHMYVFWRATSVPFLKRYVPRKYIILTGILLWISFYMSRILGHRESSILATMGECIGMSWMATLFLIFVCLLAVDGATGFGLIFPHRAPSLRGIESKQYIGLRITTMMDYTICRINYIWRQSWESPRAITNLC